MLLLKNHEFRVTTVLQRGSDMFLSCMIFIFYSFYILFFLWTWSFFMPFSIMTSPCYYDVTHFLIYLNENCTAYVKLKIKYILFERIFFIFGIFIEKIMINYENHVNCQVTLHLPPIPFGPTIRVGFVRDTFLTYLRILFQH